MKNVLIKLGITFLPLVGVSSPVSAQETVITLGEGSYTQTCEQAARNIGKSQGIEITGSRLKVSPVEICTLAIREDSSIINRASNHNNRGVLLFSEGQLAEALRDFEEAVRRQDQLAMAHVNRGYTLVALERWDEAVTAFDRGIELGAEEAAKAHFNRAIAHEELGHVREAYRDYMKAAELDPEWEEPRQELTRFSVGGN